MIEKGILYYEYNCYIDITEKYFNWQKVLLSKHKKYGTVVAYEGSVPKLIPANGRERYLDDKHIGFDTYIDDEGISITMYDFNENADDEFMRQVIAVLAEKFVKAKKQSLAIKEYEK